MRTNTLPTLGFAFLLAGFTATAFGQSCLPPPVGLVGWWSGDGHTFDLSPSGYNASLAGATYATGKVGQAFDMHGSGSDALVGSTPGLHFTNNFSFAAWFRPTVVGGSLADPILGREGEYMMCILPDQHVAVIVANTTPGWGTESWRFVDTGYAVPTNEWTHAAVVYSNSVLRMYVNGTLRVDLVCVGNVGDYWVASNQFRIGGRQMNNWEYFYTGQVDEVLVFNRPLLSEEVAAIYAAGSAGLCQPAGPPGPVDFFDDFSSGLNTNLWQVNSNDPLFSLTDTNGELRLSRPVGGNYSMHYMEITFTRMIEGDFDASVDIRDASINRVDGSPGNQIQLNTGFGGQYLCVVRSDETGGGQNAHVWRDPPASWTGTISTTATNATLRVKRVGSTVTAYFEGTVLHSGSYNASPLTYLALTLQNNGTRDATSVVFDNFHLRADRLVPEPVQLQAPGQVGNHFEMRLVNPTPGTWHWIERTPVLPATGGWTIRDRLTGGAFPTNWSDTLPLEAPAGFYRVRSQ